MLRVSPTEAAILKRPSSLLNVEIPVFLFRIFTPAILDAPDLSMIKPWTLLF